MHGNFVFVHLFRSFTFVVVGGVPAVVRAGPGANACFSSRKTEFHTGGGKLAPEGSYRDSKTRRQHRPHHIGRRWPSNQGSAITEAVWSTTHGLRDGSVGALLEVATDKAKGTLDLSPRTQHTLRNHTVESNNAMRSDTSTQECGWVVAGKSGFFNRGDVAKRFRRAIASASTMSVLAACLCPVMMYNQFV